MIVVTGGAGFIGSCFVAALNAAGRNDIIIVDSLGTGSKWKNLVGKSYIDIVSKEDFRDQLLTGDVPGGVDAVVHLGACSSTTETNADYLFDNNYRYSVDVAEWAFERDIRFIYASSAATYGDGSCGYSDVTTDLRPLNMYGYSKHLFDTWLRARGLDTQCVGLKFFNVFGPNEYHKGSMSSMIYKAAQQAQQTGTVKLFESNSPQYANGEQRRDFVYVKDVCEMMLRLVNAPEKNGILNVGTGQARTWNELVRAVFAALNMESRIEYIPMPSELQKQYQNYTEAEMSIVRKLLPEQQFQSLESSIADYVQTYLTAEWQYL